jgi:LysM repeat protein
MAAVMSTTRYAPSPNPGPTSRPVLVRRVSVAHTPMRPRVATYRLRRFAAVLLGFAMVLVAGRAAAGAVGGSPLVASHRPPSTVSYVVQPGDSLWSVAEHVDPADDPRQVVDELSVARQGAPLLPGETIVWQVK